MGMGTGTGMGTGVPGQGQGYRDKDVATQWCWGHGDGVDMGWHGDTQGDNGAVGQGGGVARCGDSGRGDSGCGHWAAPTTRHPGDAGSWRGEEGPWTWWRCPRPQGGGGPVGGGSASATRSRRATPYRSLAVGASGQCLGGRRPPALRSLQRALEPPVRVLPVVPQSLCTGDRAGGSWWPPGGNNPKVCTPQVPIPHPPISATLGSFSRGVKVRDASSCAVPAGTAVTPTAVPCGDHRDRGGSAPTGGAQLHPAHVVGAGRWQELAGPLP